LAFYIIPQLHHKTALGQSGLFTIRWQKYELLSTCGARFTNLVTLDEDDDVRLFGQLGLWALSSGV
jgi:hypothetical protein